MQVDEIQKNIIPIILASKRGFPSTERQNIFFEKKCVKKRALPVDRADNFRYDFFIQDNGDIYLIQSGGGNGPVKPGNRMRFGANSVRSITLKLLKDKERNVPEKILFFKPKEGDAFLKARCLRMGIAHIEERGRSG